VVEFLGLFRGRNLKTGQVEREFIPDVDTYWFHHRCYRSKATDNYLLTSRTGIEFIDPRSKHWEIHHWVRGACLYGIMPANGLVYAPPHPCACYLDAKLAGFNALAPLMDSRNLIMKKAVKERIEKGPAYNKVQDLSSDDNDWPMYRNNSARSGMTSQTVAPELSEQWKNENWWKTDPRCY
jgi:hypothetical protein